MEPQDINTMKSNIPNKQLSNIDKTIFLLNYATPSNLHWYQNHQLILTEKVYLYNRIFIQGVTLNPLSFLVPIICIHFRKKDCHEDLTCLSDVGLSSFSLIYEK